MSQSGEEGRLALLFMIIDTLPHEDIWRAWLGEKDSADTTHDDHDEQGHDHARQSQLQFSLAQEDSVEYDWEVVADRLLDGAVAATASATPPQAPCPGAIAGTSAGAGAAAEAMSVATHAAPAVYIHAKFPERAAAASPWVAARLLRQGDHCAFGARVTGEEAVGGAVQFGAGGDTQPRALRFLTFNPDWGTPQITMAMVALLHAALDPSSPQNALNPSAPGAPVARFAFLSESCLPVVPLHVAVSRLMARPYSGDAAQLATALSKEDEVATEGESWLDLTRRPNNGYSARGQFQAVRRSESGFPRTLWKADQWICLTRGHACEVVRFVEAHGGLGTGRHEALWPLARCFGTDELFVPTVLLHQPPQSRADRGVSASVGAGGGSDAAAGKGRLERCDVRIVLTPVVLQWLGLGVPDTERVGNPAASTDATHLCRALARLAGLDPKSVRMICMEASVAHVALYASEPQALQQSHHGCIEAAHLLRRRLVDYFVEQCHECRARATGDTETARNAAAAEALSHLQIRKNGVLCRKMTAIDWSGEVKHPRTLHFGGTSSSSNSTDVIHLRQWVHRAQALGCIFMRKVKLGMSVGSQPARARTALLRLWQDCVMDCDGDDTPGHTHGAATRLDGAAAPSCIERLQRLSLSENVSTTGHARGAASRCASGTFDPLAYACDETTAYGERVWPIDASWEHARKKESQYRHRRLRNNRSRNSGGGSHNFYSRHNRQQSHDSSKSRQHRR